jgi:hypothetical protein
MDRLLSAGPAATRCNHVTKRKDQQTLVGHLAEGGGQASGRLINSFFRMAGSATHLQQNATAH